LRYADPPRRASNIEHRLNPSRQLLIAAAAASARARTETVMIKPTVRWRRTVLLIRYQPVSLWIYQIQKARVRLYRDRYDNSGSNRVRRTDIQIYLRTVYRLWGDVLTCTSVYTLVCMHTPMYSCREFNGTCVLCHKRYCHIFAFYSHAADRDWTRINSFRTINA
jgi:hypothetical protein